MRLRELLGTQQWQGADRETARRMIEAAGRQEVGWLDRESIDNFPCADLKTIDQLWVRYSKGHFGFSVQKQIWLEVGGRVDYETECKLGVRLGWRIEDYWLPYRSVTSSLDQSPAGHLPFFRGCLGPGFPGPAFVERDKHLSSLAQRLVNCNT